MGPLKSGEKQPLYVDGGVPMGRRNPQTCEGSGDWGIVSQITVPSGCRQHVPALAHDHLWFGHLSELKPITSFSNISSSRV